MTKALCKVAGAISDQIHAAVEKEHERRLKMSA
jgi:hypothetical protein